MVYLKPSKQQHARASHHQPDQKGVAMNFRINVSTANPSTNVRNALLDTTEATDRATVNKVARNFLERGYWVEVFDAESSELLAGPFDPDQALPGYIV